MSDLSARLLGNMSWTEAQAAAADGAIVLLPIGMVEQHGPHLPLNADSLVASWVAERVSEQIVAPVLNYGHSPILRGYAGTIHLRAETLRLLVSEIISELARHGFRRIVVVNNHGGNVGPVTEAALDARRELGILVGYVYPWALGYELMADEYVETDVLGHGAEPEHSAMLAMFPDLVQSEKVVGGGLTGFDGWRPVGYTDVDVPGHSARGTVFWEFSEISPSGVLGDPTTPSLDKGKLWVERVVGFVTDFVREYDANTRNASWASVSQTRADDPHL